MIHTQQTRHSEADTKVKGQLHLAQGQIASLQAQLATASEAASQSQLMQSLQLKKLSEQHSGMLAQLKLDHEMRLKAVTEHHEVSIQLSHYSLMTSLHECSCCLHEDCAFSTLVATGNRVLQLLNLSDFQPPEHVCRMLTQCMATSCTLHSAAVILEV